ncbi:MAG: amylo-alpha,6-glucosidase [Hyphomicrobiales bacterium]|nr:amylo-alpha,6-glucosidase [Hyphomicrobiales bacterium]
MKESSLIDRDAGESKPIAEFYVETPVSLVERVLHSLKEGDCFAVLDSNGDMGAIPNTPEGLFFRDTRYLSRFELRFNGLRLMLLGSVLQDDNAALSVDATNPDVHPHEENGIPRDTIAISRTKFLWDDVCFERIGLKNFDSRPRSFSLDLIYDADFRDLFEVRGLDRVRRGRVSSRLVGDDGIEFAYLGLDEASRTTTIVFSAKPARLTTGSASFQFNMPSLGAGSLLVRTICEEQRRETTSSFVSALRDKRRLLNFGTRDMARIECADGLFDEIVRRSASDLSMLSTDTGFGRYPYAGIPWYSTAFGRDGIITAMQMLCFDPGMAAGVLRYLSATQATDFDPKADAEPGKILHERRRGEMARTGEVPFECYYGTVDATPLFIMLAGMYFERTGDLDLLKEIWPSVQKALVWCDELGDRDGDGFIEYFRATEHGLQNQGWKDSHETIFHADGSSASRPNALCEVQAYLFGARLHAATLAVAMGDAAHADRLRTQAAALRDQFEAAFWCDDIGAYALALDGAKKPCRVRASNAGHALFTGIASCDHAARTVETLMSPDSFSGWGVRTLARGEARFNPMSYHNGSIWPHDNALIATGFGRYGFKLEARRIAEAVFDAAAYQDHRRLPELYCGFLRRRRRGPVRYPVACSPQAWAAAAPFGLIAACLGMRISSSRDEVRLDNPLLPARGHELIVRRLHVGDSVLDLKVYTQDGDVAVNVLRRDGDASVIVSK